MGVWKVATDSDSEVPSSADSGISISLGRYHCFVEDSDRRTQKGEHLCASFRIAWWHLQWVYFREALQCLHRKGLLLFSHSEIGTKWPYLIMGFLSYFKSHQSVNIISQNHGSFPFLFNNTSEYIFKLTSRGCLPFTNYLPYFFDQSYCIFSQSDCCDVKAALEHVFLLYFLSLPEFSC